MKALKIINILCYFSLLSIPTLIAKFILSWHTPVQIASIIVLAIVIIDQKAKYKKLKKYIGIRIFTTIVITVMAVNIINSIYAEIKTMESNKILNQIQKIEFEDIVLEKEDVKKTKLEFVSEKSCIFKNSEKCKIYYINGKVEETYLGEPGQIIEINNDKYYFRNSKIKGL